MRELLETEIQFISGGNDYPWWQVPLYAGVSVFLADGSVYAYSIKHRGLMIAGGEGYWHGFIASVPTMITALVITSSIELATTLGLLNP